MNAIGSFPMVRGMLTKTRCSMTSCQQVSNERRSLCLGTVSYPVAWSCDPKHLISNQFTRANFHLVDLSFPFLTSSFSFFSSLSKIVRNLRASLLLLNIDSPSDLALKEAFAQSHHSTSPLPVKHSTNNNLSTNRPLPFRASAQDTAIQQPRC